MSTTWVVRFCEDCSRAFDVAGDGHGRAQFCDECRRRRKLENKRRWRGQEPRRFLKLQNVEQKKEHARKRKADWRARTGRH